MRLQFDDLTFDSDSRQIRVTGKEMRLSPKAFELLALLIDRRPNAVSKADIRDRLWPGTFVSESSLPSLVSEIRGALGDDGKEPRFIRTVHGFGYAFQAQGLPATDGAPTPSAVPEGWLTGTTAEIALGAGENILGREGEGVILLKSSTVSRRHVRIVIAAGRATIEDLGSKNGTFVNDRRVEGPTPVVEGDQVRLGSLLFTFRLAQAAGSTETATSTTAARLRT